MRFLVLNSLVVALGLTAAAHSLSAQTARTLGDLTTTNNLAPFNLTAYGSVRYQTAYSATELNFPGGALITQIRVHGAVAAAGAIYGNLRLRLAHSSLTPQTITTTFDTNYTAPITTVLGPVNFQPTSAPGQNGLLWWFFPLATPYAYNGTDTLLVDWSYESITGAGFNVSSAAGRQRDYIRPAPMGYLEPTALTTGDSGNYGIEFTILDGPRLTVAASAGSAQNVYTNATGPGGNGINAGTFTVTGTAQLGASLTQVMIAGSGTGNDQAAYSQVALYRDFNNNSTFDFGTDTLTGTAGGFPSNDGTITFAVPPAEQAFALSESRRYFIIVKLAGTAAPGETLNFAVSDITVTGTNASKGGVPSGTINGLTVIAPAFVFTDASAAAPATAFVGSGGNMVQEFSLGYPAGPDNKPTSITITGLGTGNELTHLANVALWFDANSNGTFESGADIMVDNGAFSADNGIVVFDTSGLASFQATQTRTFFVVYDLNLLPAHNQTFKSYVSAAAGAQFGATNNGLPAPGVAGTAGLVVNATLLTATLNGPGLASTVQNNSAGITGDGELLCDVSLASTNGNPWNLGGLTFNAAGIGTHDTAFLQLGLYEDTGNGVWDGAVNDGAAAGAMVAFGAGPGYAATFVLSNDLLPSNATRRFFLVGKLNGSAISGQTFNARLEAITGTPPLGGIQMGFPTADSTALVIAASVLTVANGPSQPSPLLHKAGSTSAFVMGKFRFGASNDSVTISGVTLTMTGSGNWASSMDPVTGVQVYLDDGDNFFNAATDTLISTKAGAPSVNALFTSSVIVPNSGTKDIWVRINLLATADTSALAPITYSMTIANPSDVACSTTVLLGTPAPQGAILTVVNLTVTDFDPLTDVTAGGKPITITGTGFMTPFTATIGGVVCPGTPTVSPTQVTGLTVPAGTGSGHAIVITSGTLPPETLPDTFDYANPNTNKGSSGGGGGCVAGLGVSMLPMLGLLMLGGLRRRRK